MKKYRALYICLIAILAISACTPVSTPQPPSLETIVAATYAAAKAQTEAAMPSETPIPTTPTAARATLTPFPTATIFVLPSFTPTFTASPTPVFTVTNITSGSGDVLYACNIVSISPESG